VACQLSGSATDVPDKIPGVFEAPPGFFGERRVKLPTLMRKDAKKHSMAVVRMQRPGSKGDGTSVAEYSIEEGNQVECREE
jgi:hypothetical protein